VIDPKATYIYAGESYPPDQHGQLPDAAKAALAKRAGAPPAPAAAVAPDDPLAELVGGAKLAAALREAGYGDVSAIRAASDADLTGIEGIGEATLTKLRIATAG